MRSEYQVQTARTAKFPAFWVFDHRSELESDSAPHQSKPSRYSNTTGVVQHALSSTVPIDLQLAIQIPDSYPQMPTVLGDYLASRRQTYFKTPHHGWSRPHEVITRPYEAASLRRVALGSSETEPSSNTVTSLLSSNENSTAEIPGLLVVLGITHALVEKEADAWLLRARAAARAGDLRAGYYGVYRALDVLMKNAQWVRVSTELQEICSDSYPPAFGIGAMRFASKAAVRIPNWNVILKRLMLTAKREKVDVRQAFRGLVEIHGAK